MMKPGKAYKLLNSPGELSLFPDLTGDKRTGTLVNGDKFLALEPSYGVDKILFNGIIYYAYISEFWIAEINDEG